MHHERGTAGAVLKQGVFAPGNGEQTVTGSDKPVGGAITQYT